MTDEEKIALCEKLCERDKYEEVYSVSTSGRNDHDLSRRNTVIYYSEEFKIWVTVHYGARGRRGERYFLDITKSYSNPREENEDDFDYPF